MVRDENLAPFDLEDAADAREAGGETLNSAPIGVNRVFAGDDEPTDARDAPFVGRWTRLISTTNWEKGRIISQWRTALIESGAAATEYSDEAWAQKVGGVTAPHVGRLRRVHDAFGESYETYSGLYWTHFMAALDWDDAPLWLEGAVQSGWSVSAMRKQRWIAQGGDEATRPDDDVPSAEIDEDFDPAATSTQPAQGGGSDRNYEDAPNGIASGPADETPDFGDEESLNRLADDAPPPAMAEGDGEAVEPLVQPLVQPFAELPELPDDLADAVEMLKLAVLRHKTAGWREVSAETVTRYLQAFQTLVAARPQ